MIRIPSLPAAFAFTVSALAQDLRPLPSIDAATAIFESAAGQRLGWSDLLDRLAKLDVVFLGETHVDDTTHRVELHVLEQLIARRQGKVVLSMEMFERDVQPVLDDYLAGRIDEAAFVHRARAWGNYREDYRPLIECAKAAKIPVVAANFPASLRRQLAMGGKQAVDALAPAQRAWLPEVIHPASDAYWERVARAVRGHAMGAGAIQSAEDKLYDAQNLWDNAMGDAVAKAHAAHPGHLVLHIAGGFHVAYRDGTVAQFRLRAAAAKTAVVQVSPAAVLHLARPDRDRDEADYLVYAAALARSEHDETYAVSVPAELRYRLSSPGAPSPLPLFVWLPDRGTRAEDAFAFWSTALGGQAVVAVVEPPLPEIADDLADGGRYAFGAGFRADYARVVHGLEQIVEYVTRRSGADPAHVLVAGEGDGGAAVLWAALYGQWLDADMLAIDPADLTRLSMEALPDRAPATRSLQLATMRGDAARLAAIAADFARVGTEAGVIELSGKPGGGADVRVAAVRRGLGLAEPPTNDGPVFWLVLESNLPRARQWAEIYAQRLARDGSSVRVVLPAELPADPAPAVVRRLRIGGDGHWQLASFADGTGLPLAGGPFGGTTVVVLPAGASDADLAAWQALEQSRAIKHRSRFANLAVARQGDEPSLPAVLEQLRQKGRSRVLVVPAVFCANAETMQALRRELGGAGAGMDLWWLPGLGGELVRG
jgi:uncharacterized iron-regulated protein